MSLCGQSVCVVGGTAGIGLAIACDLVRQGDRVTIAGRDGQKTKRVVGSIEPDVKYGTLAVVDPNSIETFFASMGPIDHLVVTAAPVRGGAFSDGSIEDAPASFDGKFWYQYLWVRAAHIRRSVMLTSGTLSKRAFPGTSALAAVNGAIEALGRALALELAPVRVNVLSPGFVRYRRL